MTRRTRRNLSDPRIKKILKEQEKISGSGFAPSGKPPRNRPHWIYHLSFYLLLALGVIVLLKSFNVWEPPDLSRLTTGIFQDSSQEETKAPLEAKSNKPTSPEISQTEVQQVKTEQPPPPEPIPRKIQVEVFNGCGVDGLASRMTEYLRRNDIDVVKQDNYQHFNVKQTFLLNRSGNLERVQRIAELIGIPKERIQEDVNEALQVDASLVIGADYKTIKPFKK